MDAPPEELQAAGWRDVSALLDDGAAALRLGELVQSPTFSMYEAMSAVQMMEPRMDVGMDPAGCRSLEDSLASGAAPALPTPAQALEVVEGLLARIPLLSRAARGLRQRSLHTDDSRLPQLCEASWHAGHTLADTLLTCLYLQAPEALSAAASPPLRAALAAARASLGLAVRLATRADVFEEEDFVLHLFGFSFEADSAPEAVARAEKELESALVWLEGAGEEAGAPDVRSALAAHLLLRLRLLQLDTALHPPEAGGSRDPGRIIEAQRAADAAGAALDALVALVESTPGDSTPASLPRCAFDPACSRRLLGGSLPRVIDLLPLPQACAALRRKLASLGRVFAFLGGAEASSLQVSVSFLDSFSRGEQAGPISAPVSNSTGAVPPDTLTRSAALLLLLPPEPEVQIMVLRDIWAPCGEAAGAAPCAAEIDGGAVVFVCPPLDDVPPPLLAFLSTAARAVEGLFRALSSSRPRCRRHLRHVCAEWSPLVAHARQLESPALTLQSLDQPGDAHGAAEALAALRLAAPGVAGWAAAAAGPAWRGERAEEWAASFLSAWAARWCAAVQAMHLETGLALQLYGDSELGPLAWYLEYLWTVQVEALHASQLACAQAAAFAPLQRAQAASRASTLARSAIDAVPVADRRGRKKAEEKYADCCAVAREAAKAAVVAATPSDGKRLRLALAQQQAWAAYVRLLVAQEGEERLETARYTRRDSLLPSRSDPPPCAGQLAVQRRLPPLLAALRNLPQLRGAAAATHDQWELHVQSALPHLFRRLPEVEPDADTPPLLYRLAEERFKQAAALFRAGGEAGAARVCAANGVASALLAGQGGSALRVSLEGGHRGWPLVKVQR